MCSGFFDPSLAAATLFVGIAIRFLDDYLDYQQDELLGRRTSWHYLQGAGIVYAMVALALGVRIAPSWGAALFFAAYGIGMATDPKAMLPSHLAGGMELVLASITAVIVGGWNLGLAALSLMLGLDILDDCLDLAQESRVVSVRNWASLYGRRPAVVLACLAILSSLFLAAREALWGLLWGGAFLFFSWRREGRGR
ncbi:MAG: hypothetical protein GX766_05685 [Firmicutes bacterium]|jgi:hypothetical protein|nr:hypothetical protein [Bacillota bacterium]HQD38987.1 hypothetical protein [Bacillota bacterium]